MTRRPAAPDGFTLVEMIVAAAVMVTALGAVFAVFHPTHGTFQSQPEVSDLQQRLRVGADALTRALLMAGAGTYTGPATGTLLSFFAPIIPGRVDSRGQTVGPARSDTVTVTYVPQTSSQTATTMSMASASGEIHIDAGSGCPVNDPLCGFAQGMRAVIFDAAGSRDLFTVATAQAPPARLSARSGSLSKAYEEGAAVAEVRSDTYYFDATALQLRRYDGDQSDLPVLDNVVDAGFVYFGDASPPALIRPLTDPEGPWTTYGPRPPPIGVDPIGDSWPAGENCVFRTQGGEHVARLDTLGSPGALVPLTLSMLSDGPWCPDASSLTRYDADLLRIRRVRFVLRLQTGMASLRGVASAAEDALFRRSGTSRGGYRSVPDEEIHVDVTPRNLGFSR